MKKKHHFYGGFRYALDGIKSCFKSEANMRIHLLMTMFVVIGAFVFNLSVTEWCICLMLCGGILALELVNTSIEAVVNLVTEEYHPLAKIAKDTAAGAVFLFAIFSAIIGCIIFLPKILKII